MRSLRTWAALAALSTLAACQSSGTAGKVDTADAATASETQVAATDASGAAATETVATPAAFAAQPAPSAAAAVTACAVAISGPPPAPAKGADFAKNAVGKNLARNVGRNVLGSVLGGGAVGGAISSQVVRTEQDLQGKWSFNDGTPTCGCEVQVNTGSGFTRSGFLRDNYTIKVANSGSMKNLSCSHPQLAAVNRFGLGHSFTGYDAELEIKDANGATVARLKRNGINHFSGSLTDGSPVTMWRRGG